MMCIVYANPVLTYRLGLGTTLKVRVLLRGGGFVGSAPTAKCFQGWEMYTLTLS